VAEPLDVTKYLTQPCSVISADYLKSAGLPNPGNPDLTGAVAEHVGPACDWRNSEAGTGVRVGILTGNKHGLDDLYTLHDQGTLDGYWIPDTVKEYPAVFNDSSDYRSHGECTIAVGVSDTLAVGLFAQYYRGRDGCAWVKGIAGAMIDTIKAGA
jgi:uncharacterized protein DUF3558